MFAGSPRFQGLGIVLSEFNCLSHYIVEVIGVQVVVCGYPLGLCFLTSEGITYEAQFEVEVLRHLGPLVLGSLLVIQVYYVLYGITQDIVIRSL